MEDKTKTYIPIFRRRCRFLYIALLRSYTVPCYSLLLVFRPMYVYKSVLMYMLISMGLFRSFSVLHVRIIRRRRYDAVMHSQSCFVKSTKLASLFTCRPSAKNNLCFNVTFHLFRLIIPAACASFDSFSSLSLLSYLTFVQPPGRFEYFQTLCRRHSSFIAL